MCEAAQTYNNKRLSKNKVIIAFTQSLQGSHMLCNDKRLWCGSHWSAASFNKPCWFAGVYAAHCVHMVFSGSSQRCPEDAKHFLRCSNSQLGARPSCNRTNQKRIWPSPYSSIEIYLQSMGMPVERTRPYQSTNGSCDAGTAGGSSLESGMSSKFDVSISSFIAGL